MKKPKIGFATTVLVFVILLSVAAEMFLEMVKLPPEGEGVVRQSNGLWIEYRDGQETKEDSEALTYLLMEKTGCGIAGLYTTELVVLLPYDDDAKPRQELVQIVNDVVAQLPKGHPFTVRVQTLAQALDAKDHELERVAEWRKEELAKFERSFKRIKEERDRLIAIHH